MKYIVSLFAATLLAFNSYAATYYAAPSALGDNTGADAANAWELAYALAHCGTSNTVIAISGTYSNTAYGPSFNGVTLKSQTKWGAKIYGGISGIAPGGYYGMTIDGFEIAYTTSGNGIYITGNSHDTTVRNCWIHHINNSGGAGCIQAFGSGVYNTLMEYNLLEKCTGADLYCHGAYFAGTNIIFRNNVCRYNQGSAFTIGSGNTGDVPAGNIYAYNNLCYYNTNWSGPSMGGFNMGKMYFYGNTFYGTNNVYYASTSSSSTNLAVYWTNNIMIGFAGIRSAGGGSPTLAGDYNIVSSTGTLGFSQAHGIVSSAPGFVNTNNGLFWLASGSVAQNAALNTIFSPIDFFGNSRSSISDIGFFQYGAAYASDTRNLSTSPADYWVQLMDIIIGGQPQSTSVACGSTATFSVSASGGSTLSYQWYLNGSPVGSNSSSYTTPATDATYNGASVYVVVTDTSGSLQSSTATLTVTGCSGGTTTTTKKTLGSRSKGRGTL